MTESDVMEMQKMSYAMKVARNKTIDSDEMAAAGQALYALANILADSSGPSAFTWHLAADACRLVALSMQEKVSDTHLASVMNQAVVRLDRQIGYGWS